MHILIVKMHNPNTQVYEHTSSTRALYNTSPKVSELRVSIVTV